MSVYTQNKAHGRDIKWNYTDYQLMEELDCLKEVWLKRKIVLLGNIDTSAVDKITKMEPNEKQKGLLKEYLESLKLVVSMNANI